MESILIIDDDKGIRKQLKWSLSDYNAIFADDRESAITAVRRYEPKIVTLDLGLPPDAANATEGLAALEQILAIAPTTKVIVITGNDDRTNALKAIAAGAYDFYQKPIEPEVINIIVARAFSVFSIEKENRELHAFLDSDFGMLGNSDVIERLRLMIERIAPTTITALLLGESGTGKEVAAKAIHMASDRSDKPFIAINCASIPENLLESELFGFEKGAYTGAHRTTLGKIECAQGGTLFLDEIGDMPLSLQAKLLRFLQEKCIERLGGRKEIPVDVRVICATNQPLQEMVVAKTFREDLFYRINEMSLNIPPLREREQDVFILGQFFLQHYALEFKRHLNGFSDNALSAMKAYNWPGNIRELQNKVKSSVIMAMGKQVKAADLGFHEHNDETVELNVNLRQVREQAEIKAIKKAYALADGKMSKTAELLGITRPTIYSLIEKYSLSMADDTK
jgi:two-component system NtrC family response regulator